MDREAWRATVHGVAKSWTRLSDWTELIRFYSPVFSAGHLQPKTKEVTLSLSLSAIAQGSSLKRCISAWLSHNSLSVIVLLHLNPNYYSSVYANTEARKGATSFRSHAVVSEILKAQKIGTLKGSISGKGHFSRPSAAWKLLAFLAMKMKEEVGPEAALEQRFSHQNPWGPGRSHWYFHCAPHILI